MEIQKIAEVAKKQLLQKRSHDWKEKGNKFYHGQRVAHLALELRKRIIPSDDSHDEIITAAALLHDLSNGKENHCEDGAHRARKLLQGLADPSEIDKICNIIKVHDDRSCKVNYSIYIKLHQDADHLDHFGTFDVWTAFLYSVRHDMTLLDTAEFLKTCHYDGERDFRSELNFDLSKVIYDEKAAFVKGFGQRMSLECRGDIWDPDNIILK